MARRDEELAPPATAWGGRRTECWRMRLRSITTAFGVFVPLALLAEPVRAQPADREVLVQGFRSPSMGVELKDGFLGFSVGLYPTTLDRDRFGRPRTTWFLKTGLTGYFASFDSGSGRPSSPFVSIALVQGLGNHWDVARSIHEGAGLFFDIGFRWAAWRGLDLRLGAGLLIGSEGRVALRPTPGIGWAVVAQRRTGS